MRDEHGFQHRFERSDRSGRWIPISEPEEYNEVTAILAGIGIGLACALIVFLAFFV